jgi:hypothetical protein
MPGAMHLFILCVVTVALTLVGRSAVRINGAQRIESAAVHGQAAVLEAKGLLLRGRSPGASLGLNCSEHNTPRGRITAHQKLCSFTPPSVTAPQTEWHSTPFALASPTSQVEQCSNLESRGARSPNGPVAKHTCTTVPSTGAVVGGNLTMEQPFDSCLALNEALYVLGAVTIERLDLNCPLSIQAVGSIEIREIVVSHEVHELNLRSSNGAILLPALPFAQVVSTLTRFPLGYPVTLQPDPSVLVLGFLPTL